MLALGAGGKSIGDIAAALIVTESTAKYHVSEFLKELRVGGRAEARRAEGRRGSGPG